MTTALWIIQGLLAAAFLMAGLMKLVKSRADLEAKGMGWVEGFSDGQVKAIGAVEVLGGIGVILPGALGIVPVLSGVAAAGLVLTMVGAAITHVRRNELPVVAPNVVLGALAGYVAYSWLM
jgi:uncharacterized membrane protein YphA (DoxX/SURF4 family)